jgi:hypothetical protein
MRNFWMYVANNISNFDLCANSDIRMLKVCLELGLGEYYQSAVWRAALMPQISLQTLLIRQTKIEDSN